MAHGYMISRQQKGGVRRHLDRGDALKVFKNNDRGNESKRILNLRINTPLAFEGFRLVAPRLPIPPKAHWLAMKNAMHFSSSLARSPTRDSSPARGLHKKHTTLQGRSETQLAHLL
jgi:hypothetical protein